MKNRLLIFSVVLVLFAALAIGGCREKNKSAKVKKSRAVKAQKTPAPPIPINITLLCNRSSVINGHDTAWSNIPKYLNEILVKREKKSCPVAISAEADFPESKILELFDLLRKEGFVTITLQRIPNVKSDKD